MTHFVCWDPKGELVLGETVEDAVVPALRVRGVATIPFEPRLSALHAFGGVFFRAYGRGLDLPPAMYMRVAPMMLFVSQSGGSKIALRMRLLADKKARTGALRLIQDTGQIGGASFGISGDAAVQFSELPEPDEHGGWTISAEARLGTKMDGYLPLALYGAGAGVKVAWAAIAQVQ